MAQIIGTDFGILDLVFRVYASGFEHHLEFTFSKILRPLIITFLLISP